MPSPTLHLEVTRVAGAPPSQPLQVSFNSQGGTIGRHEDNDWVLPDAQRFISGRHALISYEDGHYLVTDVSSNGVYLNHVETPLGSEGQASLQQGDTLTIGEYEINVTLQQPASLSPAADSNNFDTLEDPYARLLNENAGIHLEPDHTPIASGPDPAGANDFTLDEPEEPDLEDHAPAFPSAPQEVSESDHVSDLNSFFSDPGMIPEDWQAEDKSLASGSPPAAPAGEVTHADQPYPNTPINKGDVDLAIEEHQAATERPTASVAPHGEEELREALARGMGLSRSLLDDMALCEMLENLGRILRSNIEGTMSILRARAQMKSEFRMSQTMIRPVENNPLKFSVNTEEALRQIIDPRSNSGYLSPLAAIREAHEDTEAHMLAVMVGMQSALKAVLLRFKPENLEQRLKQKALLDKVPLYRRAKSWELFNELYSEIAIEVEDDFQQVFGRAFSQAYESQIHRLENIKNGNHETTRENRN
jgi:type VI secretion system protein